MDNTILNSSWGLVSYNYYTTNNTMVIGAYGTGNSLNWMVSQTYFNKNSSNSFNDTKKLNVDMSYISKFFRFGKIENGYAMFKNCNSLTGSPIVPLSLDNGAHMYYGCSNLDGVLPAIFYDDTYDEDLFSSSDHYTEATNLSYMFYNCYNLQGSPALRYYQKGLNATRMFYCCYRLTGPVYVTPRGRSRAYLSNSDNMFAACHNLDGPVYFESDSGTHRDTFTLCDNVSSFYLDLGYSSNVYGMLSYTDPGAIKNISVWKDSTLDLCFRNGDNRGKILGYGVDLTWTFASNNNYYYNTDYQIYVRTPRDED